MNIRGIDMTDIICSVIAWILGIGGFLVFAYGGALIGTSEKREHKVREKGYKLMIVGLMMMLLLTYGIVIILSP